jgi:hypothetical protein
MSMTIPWQPMTVEEFAQIRRSFGDRVISANGLFWRQIRPFLFRPLLQYREYPPQTVTGPRLAYVGGLQYAVPPETQSNSFLNLLIYDNREPYSLDVLKKEERRQIRRATEVFTVSLMTDVEEFESKAFGVYRSFYDRTQYEFKSERRDKKKFSWWAHALFQHPKVIVLGAYNQNRELAAIGVWYLVEDTLTYSTFFCESKSLKLHVPSLMLHVMREAAAACPGVRQIFVGSYKFSMAAGVDNFYLLRGCKLVRKPAWLQLNSVARICLKRFAPEQFSRLVGNIQGAWGEPAFEQGTPSPKPEARVTSTESRAARPVQPPMTGPGSAGQN